MLEKDLFKDTIDQLHKDLLYLVFYFQGEPYLNPDFLEMVAYASAKGIYTATSTNAHFLNPVNSRKTIVNGLDRLIISIDGTTQEAYQQYRVGGSLSKVIEGTRNMVGNRLLRNSKKPYIVFQFLVVKHNEHQVKEIQSLGTEIGVDDVWLKTAQVADYVNDPNGLIPLAGRYSRYKRKMSGDAEPKSRMHNHCWRLWHSTVITWNGLVVPCCFDKNATHKMGDLKGKSFKEIWHGQPYNSFRRQLLQSRKNIDICANCSEGTKVWA